MALPTRAPFATRPTTMPVRWLAPIAAVSLVLSGCAGSESEDVDASAPPAPDNASASASESATEQVTLHREITEVAPGVHQISDYKLVSYYVVVGEDAAMVIDSGIGLGDPMPEVREITDLPVELLLTHGHPDHANNAPHFETVWMHPADEDLIDEMYGDPEMVADYVESRTPLRNPGPGHAEFLATLVPESFEPFPEYRELSDGQEFDLGGRTLEIIGTPGHTPGSVSVLIPESRLLIKGDALNESSIILTREGGTRDEIGEMHETFQRMQARSAEFDATSPGHDGTRIDKQLIDDYLVLTEGLLSGELEGDYEESGIRAGKVVRHGMAELWYEADR